MEPKLSIPTAIELGNGAMAVCEVPNPPDSESLLITMRLQGIKLGTTQRRQGDKEIAEATISPTEPGEYVAECSASTDKDTKKALANVTVYNLPQPLLSAKEDMEDMDDDENPSLAITCEVPPASAAIISLDLTGAELPLSCTGDVTSAPRTCTLYARKQYNGKEVTCEARMALMGKVMSKTAAMKLNIEYAPEFSEGGCPTNQTLTEGNTNVILCRAEGNPLPDVTCIKGGNSYEAGMLPLVMRNHTGDYKCFARNKADQSIRSITVTVQPAPPTSVKPPTPTTRPSNKGASSAAAMSTLALLLFHLF